MALGSAGSKTKADGDLLMMSTRVYMSHEENRYSNTIVKTSLLFMVGVLIYLVISQPTYPAQFLERSYSIAASKIGYTQDTLPRPLIDEITEESFSTLNTNTTEKLSTPAFQQFNTDTLPTQSKGESLLESTLRNASMKDKTMIITTLNAAWTAPNSIFDLFLESFRKGNQTKNLLNHILVVALDNTAYSRCVEVHSHCYALTTEGVDFSGLAKFGTGDYFKMMWRRIDFLRTVLELGYNFIFTDADVMWFRDPFPRFYKDADFQISCDHYAHNSTTLKNWPNGGYKYVKSNNRTVEFYKYWHTAKDYFPEKHDQDVFNEIKFNPSFSQIGVRIKFLDTRYFGGVCEPSRNLDEVVTMHVNCCIGLEKKIHDLKMMSSDWKNYLATPAPERNSTIKSWTDEWECGWSALRQL